MFSGGWQPLFSSLARNKATGYANTNGANTMLNFCKFVAGWNHFISNWFLISTSKSITKMRFCYGHRRIGLKMGGGRLKIGWWARGQICCELHNKYRAVIEDYMVKGYARKITTDSAEEASTRSKGPVIKYVYWGGGGYSKILP
jgi:hypothetical protein